MKRTNGGYLEYTKIEWLKSLFLFKSLREIQEELLQEAMSSKDKYYDELLRHARNAALEEQFNQKSGKFQKYDIEVKRRHFNHNKEVIRNWSIVLTALSIIITSLFKII